MKKSRRVLVIEDNIDHARTLVELFKCEGHEADYAINGYVAITMAKAFRPHVVILDLGLPGMDGYEVCSRLKQEVQKPKVIVVSGYSTEAHRKRSQAAGCDVHLSKPADPKKLLNLIAEDTAGPEA
jgi:CheY-like chemotaxis protein